MPAGRPRKPLGMTQGHRQRSGLVLTASERLPRVPKPPDGLLASSRKYWRSYWESDVAKAADRKVDLPRVVRWIRVLDEYDRIDAIFKQTRLVKGSTGQPALNPLAGWLVSLMAELRAAETELGMTPLARQRLGIAYGQARLTAQELNRLLDERVHEPREKEDWELEWEPA